MPRYIAYKDTVLRRARVLRGGGCERKRERVSVRASEQVVGRVPCAGGGKEGGKRGAGELRVRLGPRVKVAKSLILCKEYTAASERRKERRRRRRSRVSTWAVVVLGAGVEAKVGIGEALPSLSLFV